MTSIIESLESNYTSLLSGISYLASASGGTVVAAADAATLLDIMTISPPFAVIVFNGEIAGPSDRVGTGAVQQTEMEWSFFLGASSFAADGEGRLGTVGIYQMIDDVIAAVDGRALSLAPLAKAFYKRARRYNITPNLVIYEVVFRNQFVRDQPSA